MKTDGSAVTEDANTMPDRHLPAVFATVTVAAAVLVLVSLPFADAVPSVPVVAATVLAGACASAAAYFFLPRLPWVPFMTGAMTIAALMAWTGGSASPYRALIAVLFVGGATLDRMRDVLFVSVLVAATVLSPFVYEPPGDFPLFARSLEAGSWALAASVVAGVSASLRAAQRRVEEQIGFVSAVLGSLPQQAAVVDRSGRIVLTNAAWDRIHALTGAPLARVGVGADYATVCRTVSRDGHPIERWIVDMQAVIEGRQLAAQGETSMRLLDGHRYVFSMRTTALPSDSGAVVTYEDVTPIIQAEEVRQVSLERMRQLDQRKGALLRAVSHDVRTPLTIIKGSAELLAREGPTIIASQLTQLTDALTRQTRRLERMLAGLLVLAVDDHPPATSLGAPVRQRIVLRALVDEVLGTLDLSSHRLDIHVPDMIVTVDPWAVGTIIDRLVHNCLKHTPPGTSIQVDASYDTDDALTLTVIDDGPGIPDVERDHVFQSFEIGSQSGQHNPGAGIGLAVVTTLATLHGGSVKLETPPQGGARFTVTLDTAKH